MVEQPREIDGYGFTHSKKVIPVGIQELDSRDPLGQVQKMTRRKPVKFSRFATCCCFRSRQDKAMYKKAKVKVEKELELEEFIKMQKYMKTIQNCFFSKFERMLLS